MEYHLKMRAYMKEQEKRVQNRIYRRLSDLLYSRQISDKQISEILGINLEHWFNIKKGFSFCPEDLQDTLTNILGEEVIFIFSSIYCEVSPLEIKRADEV